MLVINGSQQWHILKGKTIPDKVVEINQCGDIHPYPESPIFINAEIVFLMNCDKNFIYYWLNVYVFPCVKKIYMSSNPCEKEVSHRFPNAIIYLSDFYRQYKWRWYQNDDNVIVIPNSEIMDIHKQLKLSTIYFYV